MTQKPEHIAIVGAGLVGSLLSIYLAKRGYRVSVFERRADMRKEIVGGGRSINLALSTRGIRALEEVGLAAAVRKVAIPMHGRTMHDPEGRLSFLPYGKEGQFINSVSRNDLNILLLDAAENSSVQFQFDHKCVSIDFQKTTITFQTSVHASAALTTQAFDLILAADGANSVVRSSLRAADGSSSSTIENIDHGYKEFHIPSGPSGEYLLEKNSLHIWPRESFMMIALPNPDGSFTGTLFFPQEGSLSFQSLKNDEQIKELFKISFPDLVPLIPGYVEAFKQSPSSSLATIKCWPWVKNKVVLLGDAAHAIVPFYGQGMNAGFEDCRILNELLEQSGGVWDKSISSFQELRKPDADAIATLALSNFIEMRDLVADPDFLLRKKIEAKLYSLYPEKWIPLYSMVTFKDNIRYSEAASIGKRQTKIMDQVMRTHGIESVWEKLDFKEIVDQL
jgi:kynurenine 3-monooxygenase